MRLSPTVRGVLVILVMAWSIVSPDSLWSATGPEEGLAELSSQFEAGTFSLDDASRSPLQQWLRSPEPTVRMESRLLLAKLQHRAGNDTVAIRLLEEIIDIESGARSDQRDQAVLVIAPIYQLNGRSRDALASLERVVRDERADGGHRVEAAFRCALIHREAKDEPHLKESVEWALHKGRELYSNPSEHFEFWKQLDALRRLRFAEVATDELFERADAERRAANYRKAEELYEQVLQRSEDPTVRAGARWGTADCHRGNGRVANAVESWKALYAEDPTGPYRGQTLVSLGDVSLEHEFRLDLATAKYAKAHEVLQRMEAELRDQIEPTWRLVSEDVYHRMGLVAYIRGDSQQALKWFQHAARHAKPPQRLLEGLEPTPRPIDSLIELCRSGRQLTPKDVLASRGTSEQVGLMLFIADFQMMSGNAQRALEILKRFHDEREVSKLRPAPNQVEYAAFRHTEALFALKRFEDQYRSIRDALERHPRSRWVPDLMLRQGVVEYTRRREPEAARETFLQLNARYPQHPLAESAMWYAATVQYWQGEWSRAKTSYQAFLATYPKSSFRQVIEDDILPDIDHQIAQSNKEEP